MCFNAIPYVQRSYPTFLFTNICEKKSFIVTFLASLNVKKRIGVIDEWRLFKYLQ